MILLTLVQVIFEDEKAPNSVHTYPLTPPEQEFNEFGEVSTSVKLLKTAIAEVPINPTNISMFQFSLPPDVSASASTILHGHIMAVGRSDSIVTLVDSWHPEKIINLRSHSAEVWATDFSRDGCRLLTGSRDRTVRLWNIDKYNKSNGETELQAIYRGHSNGITGSSSEFKKVTQKSTKKV